MNKSAMWIDAARCVGCGACIEVCPSGAIKLAGGAACVDESRCVGCGDCASVCPADAIHPVIQVQGELLPAPARSLATAYKPGPLVEAAGAAAVAAAVGLLAQTTGLLLRAASRQLAQPPAENQSPVANSPITDGRRVRRRRRGR